MSDFPLFQEEDDNGGGGGPDDSVPSTQDAVDDANDAFPDTPETPVVPCETPGTAPPETPPAPCSKEQMKANLDKCDGGTGVWNSAKNSVGKDPGIEVGTAAGGFGGHADCPNKKVVIKPNPDCCGATQTLIFELTNLSHCAGFDQNAKDAAAGNLNREEYTKAYERLEYESVKNSYNSFDKCSKTWGCPEGALARHGGYKSAKDFDDYYDHYLPDSHKNYYRDYWDANIKSIYEKKHPPP